MANKTKINVPQKAKFIIDTLMQAGYEAYVVGGCVRDSILGRIPDDWDITTSASPEQVKALFSRTVDTGLQHGTVTVLVDKEGFEVTTYRIDGEYEDSRHPKEVVFTSHLEEDLKRRDLTINAMAYNDTDGLVDIFGGMQDIEKKIVRCVGVAKDRFQEDALRILRAIRFSAQLGYEIEADTLEAIKELAPTLSKISAERIQVELVKLITSPHPEYLKIAYECGVTKVFFPEFDACMGIEQNNAHHCYSVGEHTLQGMCHIAPDKVYRLTMLMHDLGKPRAKTTDEAGIDHFHQHEDYSEGIAKEVLRRLKFDNDTIYKVCKLVKYHDYGKGVTPDAKIVRRAVNKIGEDIFPLLFEVRKADILAQSETYREEKLHLLALWEEVYAEIIAKKECVSLKQLAVTGADLIQAGILPGKEMGRILNGLLEMVLEDPGLNTKEKLLAEVEKYK